MKKVYAFIADGLEEVEALMVIDLLKRTHKLDVVTVSVMDEALIESSHGLKFYTDEMIDDIDFDEGDCIFLPGGMPGTRNLQACDKLNNQIKKYNDEGKLLCAICAAPLVLGHNGILTDKNATSYPGFEKEVNCKNYGGSVVRDGNVITAKGLGVALELGLEMIDYLCGADEAKRIADQIQYDGRY